MDFSIKMWITSFVVYILMYLFSKYCTSCDHEVPWIVGFLGVLGFLSGIAFTLIIIWSS
jgi:hypothetical protein